MKLKFITGLLLLLAVTFSTAQNELTTEVEDVPEAITDNHGFYFPKSENTEWRKLNNYNDELYMAKFDFEGSSNRFAYYNTKGLRVMYSQLVPPAKVPAKVKTKLNGSDKMVNQITLFNPEMTIYKVYTNDKDGYIDSNGATVNASVLPSFMVDKNK